jgi:hypothetical protein
MGEDTLNVWTSVFIMLCGLYTYRSVFALPMLVVGLCSMVHHKHPTSTTRIIDECSVLLLFLEYLKHRHQHIPRRRLVVVGIVTVILLPKLCGPAFMLCAIAVITRDPKLSWSTCIVGLTAATVWFGTFSYCHAVWHVLSSVTFVRIVNDLGV